MRLRTVALGSAPVQLVDDTRKPESPMRPELTAELVETLRGQY